MLTTRQKPGQHKKTGMQDRKSGIWNKNNYFINKDDISGKTVLFLNS